MKPVVLDSKALMKRIIRALDRREPLSVVSVGSTQSYAMAQYTVLSEEEFMNHKEAIKTNSGTILRGFRFPNVRLRDELVEAVRQADIVGYNLHLRNINAGLMTEKVFEAYGIRPKYVFESLIRRVILFSQRKRFRRMLHNRRIVLIGSIAAETKAALYRRWSEKTHFEVVECIPMQSFDELDAVKRTLDRTKYDLCLISAGVNAVILGPYIANRHGKVAFDLGQGMGSIITNEVKVTGFVNSVGLKTLMHL